MLVAQEWKCVQVSSSKKKKRKEKTLSPKLPSLGKKWGQNGESLLQNPLAARNFIDNVVNVPACLPSQRPIVNSLLDIING